MDGYCLEYPKLVKIDLCRTHVPLVMIHYGLQCVKLWLKPCYSQAYDSILSFHVRNQAVWVCSL